jgi:NAD(P)-dependent dehydrogenase (short-subunit alcohol dehydrogenase family)
MPNLFDMTGKTVLVTGGSRGLGRGLVQGFAEAGANVAIVSRKLENCETVAHEVEKLGVRAFPYGCHIGHWDEVEPMFDAVWNHFGKVDVVINNAGMSPTYPSLGAVTEKLFDSVIGVNFKGPFRLCAVAGERMYAAGGGAIINMSSIASLNGTPGTAFYGGAKAGLNVISQAFATAYHPKVRVNTVLVGPFDTDTAKHWPDPPNPANPRQTFGGLRVGLPEDMMTTALYLAADASQYVTGAAIRVDGGGWGVRRTAGDAEAVS